MELIVFIFYYFVDEKPLLITPKIKVILKPEYKSRFYDKLYKRIFYNTLR